MRCARCATRELRAEAIGLDRRRIQWISFAIAGGFAALAGALYAFLKGSVFPDNLGIPLSIDGLVMVLLGGVGTVSGGIVGAALYRSLSIWIISHTDYSKLALGLLIVVLVVLFPKGVVGAFASWRGARVGLDRRGARMSILAVERLGKNLFGIPGGQGRELHAAGWRDARADRAERRRQEHLLQHDQRPDRADQRAHQHFRPRHAGHEPGDIGRLGVGRTFQITATFASMTVARKCADGADRASSPPMAAGIAGRRAITLRRRCDLLALVGMDDQARARLRRTRLWRSQTARTRHRAGQRAEAAADGRARRRHGAQGTRRADGSDGADRARAHDRRAVHRT